ASRKPLHHGDLVADWRAGDVDSGRVEFGVGSSGAGCDGNADPHMAYGGHEPGAGDLDWRLPDHVGVVSGDVPVDVDNRGRATGGDVAGVGAGVFLFPVDPDDGGGYLLRLAEILARQRRECDRSDAYRRAWMGGAGDRVRGVVYRGIWGGGVVPRVGEEAWIRSLRGLSNHCGRGGGVLGG